MADVTVSELSYLLDEKFNAVITISDFRLVLHITLAVTVLSTSTFLSYCDVKVHSTQIRIKSSMGRGS